MTVDDPELRFHHDKPGKPHAVARAVNPATPLHAGEKIEISGVIDGSPVPGNAKHKERISGLKPPGPYSLNPKNPRTKDLRSPVPESKPEGDYGWQYELTLQKTSKGPITLDPWTVIQKP